MWKASLSVDCEQDLKPLDISNGSFGIFYSVECGQILGSDTETIAKMYLCGDGENSRSCRGPGSQHLINVCNSSSR